MGRFARGVIALVAIALVAASAVSAATPTDIYRDFEDDGRLSGRYSIADLRAALTNPAIQVYEDVESEPEFRREVAREIAEQEGGVAGAESDQEGLPFTGFDLALLTVGGILLLGVGLGLRRVARTKR